LTDEAKYVTANNADYFIVLNILAMAHQEATDILEIDEECCEAITQHRSHMRFLYGPLDAYAPAQARDHLEGRFPGVRTQLAPDHIKHAFVLQHHRPVALIVAEWLLEFFRSQPA